MREVNALIERVSYITKKHGKKGGVRVTTEVQLSSPQTSNIILFNVRLFDNMDEPGACVKFKEKMLV